MIELKLLKSKIDYYILCKPHGNHKYYNYESYMEGK